MTIMSEVPKESRATLKVVLFAAVVALSAGGSIVLGEYFRISQAGNQSLIAITILFVLPTLAALAAVPVSLCLCVVPRFRRVAFRVFLASVIFSSVMIASVRIGRFVRMEGFHALARRSRPLIEAIDRFEREHGEPPASLEALVPAYLSSVPGTGMAAYPAYRYHVGQRAEGFGDNSWALEVFTPSGILNFDLFVYYPNQNYQDSCRGRVERVGDWAYLHE